MRHVEHRTHRDADGLTDREAGILEHLDAAPDQRAGELARHLGIGKSSLSAQLKRLAALGYIAQASAADGRERRISLTDKARDMLIKSSPLSADRLLALLQELTSAERKSAISGIELLAKGVRMLALRGTHKTPTTRE